MAVRPPRRGGFWIRLELGLAAFAPAVALLAFRVRASDLVWLFVAAAVVGVLVSVAGAVVVARGNPELFTFEEIDDLSDEVLGHVGAYLLPVLVNTSGSTEEVAISAVILALIIHIHVATGRVHVNPVLYVLGYRVFRVTSNGRSFYLVARSDVSDWTGTQACVQVGSSLLVERHRQDK